MKNFEYNKNRDASATINGFVYQVNTTIEKWINLTDKEHLELEKGEDIDIVQKEIISKNGSLTEKENRILEQVKHRKSTIRLTSPEFIETLINFKEHSEKNSSINLKLSFFTNSPIGKEQNSPLTKRKGINVWNSINNNEFHGFEDDNLTLGIKELVTRGKPFSQMEKVEKWKEWKDYITKLSITDFKNIIKKVEINHTQTSSNNYSDKIIKELTSISSDKDSAKILYYKLFSFIFDILSKTGEKKLTKKIFVDIKTDSTKLINNILVTKIKSFLDDNLEELNNNIEKINNNIELNEERRRKDHKELKKLIKNNQESTNIATELLKNNLKIAISFDNENIEFVKKITNLLISYNISIYSKSIKLEKFIKDKSYFNKITNIQEIKNIDYCIVILTEDFHKNQWNKHNSCDILKFSYNNSKSIIPIKLGKNIKNIIGVTSFIPSIIVKTNEIEDAIDKLFRLINKSIVDDTKIEKEINIESVLKIYAHGDNIEKHPEIIDKKFGYRIYKLTDELNIQPSRNFLHIYRKTNLIVYTKISKINTRDYLQVEIL